MEEIGVFANRSFMIAYVMLFLCISVCASVYLILNWTLGLYQEFEYDKPLEYYKGQIASRSFQIFENVVFLCLHLLLLAVCVKFSRKLKS